MSDQVLTRISGKDLGQLALPNACGRCFWLSRKVSALPYQKFPGIFSSIDSYSKRVVHGWFDRHGRAPQWLAELGEISGYLDPPHHSKFFLLDEAIGIRLTGAPDAVFTRPDGSLVIGDYKTSRITDTQDKLFPMYAVQLNAYALIAQHVGWPRVDALALIYTEPGTDHSAAVAVANQREHGFALSFSAQIKHVPLHPERVVQLMHKAVALCRSDTPPASRHGCPDCARVREMIDRLGD
jgi:hypothetical protein